MGNYRVKLSQKALYDQEDFYQALTPQSLDWGDRVLHKLEQALEQLEKFPRSGPIVFKVGKEEIRRLISPPFRIYYVIADGIMEVQVRRLWLFPRRDLNEDEL